MLHWLMPTNPLEDAVNELSDKDWSWWPFLWMRPEKHAPLSLPRVSVLALLYGVPSSLLLALVASRQPEHAPTAAESTFAFAVFPLLFLFIGSVVVAPMWNRRAERLRGKSSTAEEPDVGG
jgi:hypothetical protein